MHPEINVRAVGCSNGCARRLDDEDAGDEGRYPRDDDDDENRRRSDWRGVILLIRKSFLLIVPYGLSRRTTLTRRRYR